MSTERPQPIAALIKATNDHDTAAFLASFTDKVVKWSKRMKDGGL